MLLFYVSDEKKDKFLTYFCQEIKSADQGTSATVLMATVIISNPSSTQFWKQLKCVLLSQL